MIRIEQEQDWLLLTHKDHARLAGEFARHWKNMQFAAPSPFIHILDAVSCHDDSWEPRDAEPELTPEGNPSAFSKELVGSYDAFEEIDLEGYLKVRGQATEVAAARDPYSAILISMHTVNLLTEQADLSGLSAEDLDVHAAFVEGQLQRQAELKEMLSEREDLLPWLSPEALHRAFCFLQACDSFSLLVGVEYPAPSSLRHPQLQLNNETALISFIPLGQNTYSLDPWPLDVPEITFSIPYRRVPKAATSGLETFRDAYTLSQIEPRIITVKASA